MNNISILEKCVYAQIEYFDRVNTCHASNAFFAKMFGVSEPTIMRAIGNLKALEYIKHDGYYGKFRKLICLVKKTSQIDTLVKLTRDTSQIDQGASIDTSQIDQQKVYKKVKKKEYNILTPKQLERKTKEKELGKQAKALLDYYFQKHKAIRGYDPMVDGARDIAIFKRILKADYSTGAIEQVIDFFFSYNKRAKFTTRALYGSFDTLYGVILDQSKGRR